MKYYFLFFFTFLITTALAQIPNQSNLLRLKGTTTEILSYKEMIGSPYRYKEFIEGSVYLKSNTDAIDYTINYNAYKDQIEFIENNSTISVDNPNEIKYIVVDQETLIYTKYYNYDDLKEGYFIELIDDYISLYKRELISINSPKNVAYNSSPYIKAEFIKLKPMFYISIYGETLVLIKNKKKLLNLFFNHPELKNFIQKEKIKLHDESDLKKLVVFLNNFDKNKK